MIYKIIDNDFDRCKKWSLENSLYPSAIDAFIGLEKDGELIACSGFGWFSGGSMHHHISIRNGARTHPAFWWYMAHYAFVQCGVNMLIGVTPSANDKALNIAKHFGYKQILTLVGAGLNGGDLIIQTLDKNDCKWLNKKVRLL